MSLAPPKADGPPRGGWLSVFRRVADEVQAEVAMIWGREEAREPTGIGAGGDTTVMIDQVAEAAAVRVLEAEAARGKDFDLISEELGERRFGRGGELVILDPIDGSVNAKMGIPYFSITMAVATGRTYGEITAGMVRNLVTGEHVEAQARLGAWRDGRRIRPSPGLENGRLRVLQIEPTQLNRDFDRYKPLVARADKVRMLGSAALNLAHTATGTMSASVASSLRSVDCAGAIPILRESGGAVSTLTGEPIDGIDLGLDGRVSLAAATTPETLRLVVDLLREGAGPGG